MWYGPEAVKAGKPDSSYSVVPRSSVGQSAAPHDAEVGGSSPLADTEGWLRADGS